MRQLKLLYLCRIRVKLKINIERHQMKTLIFSLTLLVANTAFAMTHFLTNQWYSNGSNMCQYDNGTVLNMGARICPLSIQGWCHLALEVKSAVCVTDGFRCLLDGQILAIWFCDHLCWRCPRGLEPRLPLPDGLGLLGLALRCPSHLRFRSSTSAHHNWSPPLSCLSQISTGIRPFDDNLSPSMATTKAPFDENLKPCWAYAGVKECCKAIADKARAITVKTALVYRSVELTL